jgi:tetratricopeptide (TPR) repeat protein
MAFTSPAQAVWREASSTHFLIYSEDSPARLEAFANKLERFDSGMRFMRGIPAEDPGKANRVTVYVVSDVNQVRKLMDSPKNSGVAGFYRGAAGNSIAVVPRRIGGGGRAELDPETVLLHEYAHHFMLANFAGAWPRWFVEGFAEFNATADLNADGSMGFGKPPQFRSYGLINMAPLPVEQIFVPPAKMTAEQEDVFYGRSWLLVHYLTLDPSRNGQLAKYILAINSGKPNLEAAREAFGNFDDLNRALATYLRRNRLSYFNLSAKMISAGPISVRELGMAEQALMPLRIRSRTGVDDKEAQAVLQLAEAGAAAFPNDAFAQTVLAEAEFDTDNYDAAIEAANRAIAADPKSMDGLLYRARVLEQRARKADKDHAGAWKAVRTAYIAANHVDPDDPRPLIGFYESFRGEGVTPTRSAVNGLMRALVLAPQDRNLRMTTAVQLLADDKPQEARAILGPIAYDPHSSEASQSALALIQQIDNMLKAQSGKTANATN